jgi:actin-related protein
MEAEQKAEQEQEEIFRMDRFSEAERRADEERERIIRLDRERKEKLREEAAERAQARKKEKEERRIRDKLREEAAERARARAAREKEKEEQRARENKRHYEEWARREGHNFKNVDIANGTRQSSALPAAVAKLWYQNVERAFVEYALMDTFPEPPSSLILCRKPGCIASKEHRALAACSCQIEYAITSLQLPLKKLRWAWHPDRFSSCKEEHRETFKAKATEVFQVVDSMFARERK